MEGTNFRTFYQMKGFVNDQAKQALGIDSVQTLDMKWVTVGQNKRLVQGAVEDSARATFTVNYPGSLKSLKVSMEPQQDLHGYDHPWPAGGGTNLLPNINKNTDKFTMDVDGFYTQNNPTGATWAWEYSARLAEITLQAGTYTISFYAKIVSSIPAAEVRVFAADDTPLAQITGASLSAGSSTFTLTEETTIGVCAKMYEGKWAFQVESGSTATSWTPYSNICPITGYSSVNVYHSGEDTSDYETVTVTFPADPGTVYGGTLDLVSGVLTKTWDIIASYDGETLPGEWVSDRDVYASGTTPTTGAQVAYELATPETYQLTAEDIETLTGENNIWSNAGNVTVEYYDLEEVP